MDCGSNDEPEVCQICGCMLEWVSCWMMCDDGYFDEYENDPINNDPGDMSVCPECRGAGGYLECPNAENHPHVSAQQLSAL